MLFSALSQWIGHGPGTTTSVILDEGQPQTAHPPFMIKELGEGGGAIASYCDQVLAGAIRPGIITFPPFFDLEG